MKITFPGLRTAAAAALGLLALGGPARAAVSYQDYHRSPPSSGSSRTGARRTRAR